MSYYDYKVVPAPRHLRKARGISDPAELLSLHLSEALTEQARAGWEYVRAETLPAEAAGGLFRRAVEETVTVLVFRRERDSLEPRITAVAPSAEEPPAAPHRPEPPVAAETRPFSERVREAGRPRLEPSLGATPAPAAPPSETASSPLRPTPSLGPADRS
jgi:hypothetical protein